VTVPRGGSNQERQWAVACCYPVKHAMHFQIGGPLHEDLVAEQYDDPAMVGVWQSHGEQIGARKACLRQLYLERGVTGASFWKRRAIKQATRGVATLDSKRRVEQKQGKGSV
jgi:hypothetical protein